MKKNLKVLVTGASGFLGSYIHKLLRVTAGYSCIPTSNSNKFKKYINIDLTNYNQLLKMIYEVNPDVIVNCAACVDFGNAVLSKQYDLNVVVPSIFASWAKKNSKHLIQISMATIYGKYTENIDENSPVLIDSDYAKSKWLADEMIKSSGCKFTILRFGGIYGVNGPNHLKLNANLKAISNNERPIIQSGGDAKRNYIHVHDAANDIINTIKRGISGVHLLSGTEILSFSEMIFQACNHRNKNLLPISTKSNDEIKDQIIKRSNDFGKTKPFNYWLKEEL